MLLINLLLHSFHLFFTFLICTLLYMHLYCFLSSLDCSWMLNYWPSNKAHLGKYWVMRTKNIDLWVSYIPIPWRLISVINSLCRSPVKIVEGWCCHVGNDLFIWDWRMKTCGRKGFLPCIGLYCEPQTFSFICSWTKKKRKKKKDYINW